MQNTTYRRTPFNKCLLIFLRQNAKRKYNFLEKLIRKKIQKNLIVNSNNKIIRSWHLSSKWPVCKSIIMRPLEEQAEQNWVPCLKQISLNIVPFFAIKWVKYTCNEAILSIQIMGKCIFVLFWDFLPFNWGAKLVIFFLSKHLRYATYGLETYCSYSGSIKHTYISMVKQAISTS